MKRLLSVILAIIMVFGLQAQVFAAELFKDIKGNWAEADIKELAGKGVINGKGNGIFDPQGTVQVDEFIKMSVALLGNTYDVSKFDYWAQPYIEKAKELQLISSKKFTNYRRAITREEMASIAINTFSKINILSGSNIKSQIIGGINDYWNINDYYKDRVLEA